MSSLDVKWLDDFIALARERSFTRAAVLRHVTQPQFSRRIRSLELWAGADLVNRATAPLQLTAQGEELLGVANRTTANLTDTRARLRNTRGMAGQAWVTVATGRTLARMFVPQWWQLRRQNNAAVQDARLRLSTGSTAEAVVALEQGHADFMLAFAHPRLSLVLDDSLYESACLGHDELVAVSAPLPNGTARHSLQSKKPLPWLAYAPTLALAQILDDSLTRRGFANPLDMVVQSDFAENLHAHALLGDGLAWLPKSMVAQDLFDKRLVLAEPDGAAAPIRFELRLFRPRAAGLEHSVADLIWRDSIEVGALA